MKFAIIVLICCIVVFISAKTVNVEEEFYDEFDLIQELGESDDVPSGLEELLRVTRMAKNKKPKNRSKERNRSDEDMDRDKKRDANRNNNNNKSRNNNNNNNNKRDRKTNDDDDDDNSREAGRTQRVRSKRMAKKNKHSHERNRSRERNRNSGEKKQNKCTFGGPSGNSQCCKDNIEKLSNKEKVNELAIECMDELDVGDFCDSREQNRDDLNCLMQCIGQKQGTINDDGNINEEGLRDFVKNDMTASGWPRDKADQIVNKCLREIGGGSNKKTTTTTARTTTTAKRSSTTPSTTPSTTVSTTPSTTPSTTASTTPFTTPSTTQSTTPSTTPSTTTTSTTTSTTPSTTVATTSSRIPTKPPTKTTSAKPSKTPNEANNDNDNNDIRERDGRQKRQSQSDNCRSTANKLMQCLWREFTLSCPRSKRNNTKMCQRLRVQISRNEPVRLFGPNNRKGGKNRSSEEKHRKH